MFLGAMNLSGSGIPLISIVVRKPFTEINIKYTIPIIPRKSRIVPKFPRAFHAFFGFANLSKTNRPFVVLSIMNGPNHDILYFSITCFFLSTITANPYIKTNNIDI